MKRWATILLAAAVAFLLLAGLAFQFRFLLASGLHLALGEDPGSLGLREVRDVPLEGSASRFDYASIDADRGLLWLTHMGADEVVAFDLASGSVKGYVRGVATPTGVLAVPEIGRAYVSAAGTHQVDVVDEDSLQVIARVDAGDFPDGMAYDPVTRHLFVSDEAGGVDSVIDVRTDANLGSIDLGGEAGNTQYDGVGKVVVAAAEGRGALAVIDPARQTIAYSIPVPGCDGPHGFYVDAPARRAYVSCERNGKLVVVDLAARSAVATFEVGQEPDVLAFDEASHRLYVAAESGVVAAFEARDGSLAKIGQSYLAPAAHSIAVDPSTHRVYVPLEDVGGRPVLRIYRELGS
jgi:DNA-binding beta-propeller fold protein YncE